MTCIVGGGRYSREEQTTAGSPFMKDSTMPLYRLAESKAWTRRRLVGVSEFVCVCVGVWIDGIQKMMEYGEPVEDKLRIVDVTEEIRLRKIVEHACANVKSMIAMVMISLSSW